MYSLDPMLAAKAAEGARLHFSGDLTWWLAGLIGLGAAGLAAWIYRGDLRGRTTPGLWVSVSYTHLTLPTICSV